MELFIRTEGENGVEYVPYALTSEEVEAGQAALKNWKDATAHINYGLLGFLAKIGVLGKDHNGEIQINLQGFTKRSFMEGLLINEKHLPEEMTSDMAYRGIMASVKGLKMGMKKGRNLPLDVVEGLKYLAPLLEPYEYYSRHDTELSALLDELIPKLKAYVDPIFNRQIAQK